MTDRDLFSPEHAEAALADERKIIHTGKPIIDYEERETWPDREDTWVSTTKMPLRDAQGNIIGTFGISRDITEKKRADAPRNSEQERLSLALSSAEMGTWDWDMATAVIWWDERMHALFGMAPGTFKGSYEDFLGLIHEEDRKSIRGEFAHAIAARTAMDTEFQVLGRRTEAHMVRIRSRVHCDENSKILRIVGVAWDITERRETELALAKERNLLTTLMENLPIYLLQGPR